jgi:hypothetical protein
MKINVFLTIGASGICFIISWLSFESSQDGLGWLFMLLGTAIVVFSLAIGGKSA